MIKGSKICGVSDVETLKYIINHKYPPKMIGFICKWPKSKRYVSSDQLKELLRVNKKETSYVAVLVNPTNDMLEKIKDSVRYDDFSVEGNIHKILSLKKNYEKSLNEKLNLDDILKDLKKNSVIHERYEIIDFLLNLATKDETFNSKENKFIDKVSKELELNKEKYQEIKKQKTSSVKFVDFGEEVEESVFGINKDMTKDEKLKILRKEYSRWNALTKNTDKMIRERAKEMRDLAANLRSQYNK